MDEEKAQKIREKVFAFMDKVDDCVNPFLISLTGFFQILSLLCLFSIDGVLRKVLFVLMFLLTSGLNRRCLNDVIKREFKKLNK